MRCLDMLRESVRWLIVSMATAIVLGAATLTVADRPSSSAEVRVDLHGDPLPEGAIARLGTVRYRVYGVGRAAFLSDNRTLLRFDMRHLVWLDVTTGRTTRAVDLGTSGARLLAITRDRSMAAVDIHHYRGVYSAAEHQVLFIETSTGTERSRLPKRMLSSGDSGPLCAAFTPDGSRLATGHRGGTGMVRVWNVATGREELIRAMPPAERIREGPDEGVTSVSFSPDGVWLVAAGSYEAIRWRWQSDVPPERLGPDGLMQVAEFAPHSGVVAIGGPPQADTVGTGPAIRLFDVETGRQTSELYAPEGERLSFAQIAFTPDGSRLMAPVTSSSQLAVWNVQNGKLERTLSWQRPGLPTHPGCATLSPDGRWAAALQWGGMAVWDFVTGERIEGERVGHWGKPYSASVSPDGGQVLTIAGDGLAILWEAASGRPVQLWQAARQQPTILDGGCFKAGEFSPDGKWLVTSSASKVVLRHRESGEAAHTWPVRHSNYAPAVLQFARDNRTLLSFGDDWFLRAFDVQTGKRVSQHAIRPTGLHLNEECDGSVMHVFFSASPLRAAQFTPDGRALVVLSSKKVHVFDAETGREQAHYDVGQESRRRIRAVAKDVEWADDQAAGLNRHIAITPDSRRLATVGVRAATEDSREYELHIRRLEDGEVIVSFPLAGEPKATTRFPMSAMVFSPDGAKLAVATSSADARALIEIYDAATGRLEARIERERPSWLHSPGSLAFTPDGDRIVAAQADTSVLVWDWKRFSVADDE